MNILNNKYDIEWMLNVRSDKNCNVFRCIENGTFLSLDYIIIAVIIFVHLQTCAQPSENTKYKATFQSKICFLSLNHRNICEYIAGWIDCDRYQKYKNSFAGFEMPDW